MNNRANIMYFLEHLCEMASRENHIDYIRMMQRDILRIVDAVAPEDGSGAANVKVVRKVLQALQTKTFLLEQTVSEIEELLKERDTGDAHIVSSPVAAPATSASTPKSSKTVGLPQRLDKKQVEQRIEEDRERHKRQRETAWAIPKGAVVSGRGGQATIDVLQAASDAEFDKLWEETSELGEDDWDLYAEEAEEREMCAKEWKEEFCKMHSGTGVTE
jgi:CTD kinase subunit gamma